MATIKIATFNCMNLFVRYRFDELKKKKVDAGKILKNGFLINKDYFQKIYEPERKLTASAIKETRADIIVLQEVESMDSLKIFKAGFLKGKSYDYIYKMVIDANDPRLIDVAVLSKIPFESVQTHQFIRTENNRAYVFSRDCLEVNFTIKGKPLTLYVNHFKSMMGGRDETSSRRKVQAEKVRDIIKARFGTDPSKGSWIVLGDLNDYLPGDALKPLIENDWIENVVERLPKDEQWTHWYDKGNEYRQLDYILLSKSLSEKTNSKPEIIRKGLAMKADKYKGKRFPGVGTKLKSASDHCPVVMEVNL